MAEEVATAEETAIESADEVVIGSDSTDTTVSEDQEQSSTEVVEQQQPSEADARPPSIDDLSDDDFGTHPRVQEAIRRSEQAAANRAASQARYQHRDQVLGGQLAAAVAERVRQAQEGDKPLSQDEITQWAGTVWGAGLAQAAETLTQMAIEYGGLADSDRDKLNVLKDGVLANSKDYSELFMSAFEMAGAAAVAKETSRIEQAAIAAERKRAKEEASLQSSTEADEVRSNTETPTTATGAGASESDWSTRFEEAAGSSDLEEMQRLFRDQFGYAVER